MEVPRLKINPHHSYNQSHNSYKPGSLTPWSTRELLHILFCILFHNGLSQYFEYSSTCYIGPCCLHILYYGETFCVLHPWVTSMMSERHPFRSLLYFCLFDALDQAGDCQSWRSPGVAALTLPLILFMLLGWFYCFGWLFPLSFFLYQLLKVMKSAV